jgi:hypothetical protein
MYLDPHFVTKGNEEINGLFRRIKRTNSMDWAGRYPPTPYFYFTAESKPIDLLIGSYPSVYLLPLDREALIDVKPTKHISLCTKLPVSSAIRSIFNEYHTLGVLASTMLYTSG